jgi:CheY-like chemotaxis protein
MSKAEEKKKNPLIAIFNTTPEVIEVLETLMEDEGFNVVSAIVSDFRLGRRDLIQYMKDHDPDIIIYDLPPPYANQLNFLKILQNTRVLQDKKFIFTTTNKAALEKEADGKLGAIEIIGKPFDLNVLLDAVRKQVELCQKK